MPTPVAPFRPGIDHIGISVGAVIWDGGGKVLLAQRGAGAKNQNGLWENPGGAVNLGETLSGAIKREVREELGVEIEIVRPLRFADHLLPDEGQHWVAVTYLARITHGEPSLMEPDKCTALRWYDLEALPPAEAMSPLSLGDLECLASQLGMESHLR